MKNPTFRGGEGRRGKKEGGGVFHEGVDTPMQSMLSERYFPHHWGVKPVQK